jgi:CBS domain-containing protein
MTAEVMAIAPSCPIADVAQAMRQLGVGSLPVVQDGRLAGIITDRDIVLRVVADGLDPSMETAADHMTPGPIVAAAPDWELERAAEVMARAQIRRLPVLEGGRLVGYLALADLAAHQRERQSGAVLEEISRSAPQDEMSEGSV